MDKQLEKEVDKRARVYTRTNHDREKQLVRYRPALHYGKGPKNYRRSDEKIWEDACEALARSYDVNASEIDVEVKDGCVFLRGQVDDRESKRDAEDAVGNIFGVEDVQNLLRVKGTGPIIKGQSSVREEEKGLRLS